MFKIIFSSLSATLGKPIIALLPKISLIVVMSVKLIQQSSGKCYLCILKHEGSTLIDFTKATNRKLDYYFSIFLSL